MKSNNEFNLVAPKTTKKGINIQHSVFCELVKVKLAKINEATIIKMKPEEVKELLKELLRFNATYRVFNLDYDSFSKKAFRLGSYCYSLCFRQDGSLEDSIAGYTKVLQALYDTYDMTEEEDIEYCKEPFPGYYKTNKTE